ncbi:DNA repair exonuclease [Virgibacillus sp. C22-A2]|uniref:DNA repair exonuclease n=1 Tax=Virgibacillus tibetensis TaxID=3042313 RepID=A0ABU6KFN8_9BACI|nr:DNA repair exonuclease [Virgibacillus sp. C22-A2]
MSEQISFIHAADLHLDSPFKGLADVPDVILQEIRESTFVALDRLVNTAIEKKVDFILLVGDLFDNEKQSLKAQVRLKRAFEELKRNHISVYLSYGNHDYIQGNSYPVTYPDNVFIFPKEKVGQFTYKKNEKATATIYGFSYENRSVTEKKIMEYVITDDTVPFHIGMLHGSVHTNTEHDVYAPFQLSDFMEQDFNYWALGHIHQREVLKDNPLVVYPGNTQGRHRKETGEKGCYHVVLTEGRSELDFIPLQAVQFQRVELDISECQEIHQVETKIQAALQTSVNKLYDLILVSTNTRLKKWKSEKLFEDIIDLVNETIVYQQAWGYVFRYSFQYPCSSPNRNLYGEEHFIGELSRHIKEDSIQPLLKELYQQRQARKYITRLSEEEEQSIKAEAEELLLHELLKE